MSARAILDEAAAVLEARGKSYGDAAAAFAAIAERWSTHSGGRSRVPKSCSA